MIPETFMILETFTGSKNLLFRTVKKKIYQRAKGKSKRPAAWFRYFHFQSCGHHHAEVLDPVNVYICEYLVRHCMLNQNLDKLEWWLPAFVVKCMAKWIIFWIFLKSWWKMRKPQLSHVSVIRTMLLFVCFLFSSVQFWVFPFFFRLSLPYIRELGFCQRLQNVVEKRVLEKLGDRKIICWVRPIAAGIVA